MKEKTCCFTGHRIIPKTDYETLRVELKEILIQLIDRGFIYYGAGGALGFDTLAAKTILELKKQYPMIKLILVLPCLNQTYRWKEKDVRVYEDIKVKADKVVYVSKEYTTECMLIRNRHLVDNSSVCVCYKTKNTGGTAYTVRYAKERGLEIINLKSF